MTHSFDFNKALAKPQPNRKNGTSKKTIKLSVGQFELETPRDRTGSLER